MDKRTIPEKLLAIRDAMHWSQEKLAQELQVSFATINSWERGRSTPYQRHQHSIDELLGAIEAEEKRVLIIEDDTSAGLILQDYVAMMLPGWSCEIADNGYEGLLRIGLVKPRIVLLDIMMPGIDGLEVMRRMSAMPDLEETKVILVTAVTDPDILAQAEAASPFGLLHKPVDRDAMDKLLQRASAK